MEQTGARGYWAPSWNLAFWSCYSRRMGRRYYPFIDSVTRLQGLTPKGISVRIILSFQMKELRF